MFSLTTREQLLIVGLVSAAVVGAAVAHWRDVRREVPAQNPLAGLSYQVTPAARTANR